MWACRLLVACCLLFGALSAQAFERPFPPGAKRGTMTPAIYPAIVIDDKTRALAAGARIWNQDNLIEMPASLRGSNIIVNYTQNDQGEIDRVWILNAAEAAASAPGK